MGSATIKTNLGAGQYIVELTKSQAAITAQKTSLTTRKTEIEAAIAAKEIKLTALNVIQNAKYEDWKTAVGNYAVADPPTKALRKAVTDAQKAYITAQSNVNKKQTEINLLGLELVSINKRLEEIETALAVESRTVWCVDYSTALTGSVGTIEINGEADAINIMPGGARGAGLLQHPLSMTPSGVFVNSAKLPAWQKWMPTYRVGTITALDTDNNTADVALDDAKSVAQDIAINQALSLSAVPIDYMEYDADAFLVGDRVVVKFEGQKQESPKVIGFETNPRSALNYTLTHNYMIGSNVYIYYEVTIPLISLEIRSNKGLMKYINTATGEIFYGSSAVHLGDGRLAIEVWKAGETFGNQPVQYEWNTFPVDVEYINNTNRNFYVDGPGFTSYSLAVSKRLLDQIGTDRFWILALPWIAQPSYGIDLYSQIFPNNVPCSYPNRYYDGNPDYRLFITANKVGPGLYPLQEHRYYWNRNTTTSKNASADYYAAGYNTALADYYPYDQASAKFFKAMAEYVPQPNPVNAWKCFYIYGNIISVPYGEYKVGLTKSDFDPPMEPDEQEHDLEVYVPYYDNLHFTLEVKSIYSSSVGYSIGYYELSPVTVYAFYYGLRSPLYGGTPYNCYHKKEYEITGKKTGSVGWIFEYTAENIPSEIDEDINVMEHFKGDLVTWYVLDRAPRTLPSITELQPYPFPSSPADVGVYNSELPAEIIEE